MSVLAFSLAAIAATAAIAAPVGPNPPAIALTPSGKWTVEGNDGRCILSHGFTASAETVTLAIEPLPLSPTIELSLKTTSRVGAYVRKPSSLDFDDGQSPLAPDMESFDSTDGIHRVHRVSIRRVDLDRASTHGTMTVTSAETGELQLTLPQAPQALAALDRCVRTIIDNVGLAPSDAAKIAQPPKPPVMLFRVAEGYARNAEQGDLEDEAVSRYLIDAKGVATACGVIHAAQSQFLNNGTCTFMAMKGFNFSPARDAAGKPVNGLFFERNRFRR